MQPVAKLVELPAQAIAHGLGAADVGMHHAGRQRVEGRDAARFVGKDLDLVTPGGQRVGGSDQDAFGAAAPARDPIDDQADPAPRAGLRGQGGRAGRKG